MKDYCYPNYLNISYSPYKKKESILLLMRPWLRRVVRFKLGFLIFFTFLLFLSVVADVMFGKLHNFRYYPENLVDLNTSEDYISWPSKGSYNYESLAPNSPPNLVTLNSEGLRGGEWEILKPAGSKRIIVLGDSFTFNGALKIEETYPYLLERKLREGGVEAEVMNFGVGSYSTQMEVELFKARGLKYTPDIVIVQTYFNDWESISNQYLKKEPGLRYSRAYLANWIARFLNKKSNIANFLDHQLVTDLFLSRYKAEQRGLGVAGMWQRIERPLKELKRLGEQEGFQLVLLSAHSLPVRGQSGLLFRFPINDLLKNFAGEEQVEYFDLSKTIESYPADQILIHPIYDTHWSSIGNEIVAEEMYTALKKEGLI